MEGEKQSVGIWSKVDFTPAAVPSAPADEAGASEAAEWRKYWRWRRPALDLIAIAFWAYAIAKVFVSDIDESLLGDAADYRFFAFLLLAVIYVAAFRRRWTAVAGFAYLLMFPAVIIGWKLPKRLVRSGSSVLFLSIANAATTLVNGFRRFIVLLALSSFSVLAIIAARDTVVLGVAVAVVLSLAVNGIYRTVLMSVKPARFLRLQQAAIKRATQSGFVSQLTLPTEDLLDQSVVRFTSDQQVNFLQRVSQGVIAHRVLYFWAYQLERYRTSPASIFFNALSYGWLIVRVVLLLGVASAGLFHADATAFAFSEPPSFLVFLRYVIAGLYGGEIDALKPSSDPANALSIFTFATGLVVGGSLLLSSALSFRAARDESEMQDTIDEIRREGDELEQRIRDSYDVSVTEATERLEQLRYGMVGVITYFSARIPSDFENQGRSPNPDA